MPTHSQRCPAVMAAACLALVLSGCGGKGPADRATGAQEPPGHRSSSTVASPAGVTGSIEAVDQTGDGRQVIVRSADVSGAPGFIVVHREDKGGPGDVVGHAAIPEGHSTDVVVALYEPVVTGPYWVMLHRDAGSVGVYEWPGRDGPVRGPVGLAYVQTRVVVSVS